MNERRSLGKAALYYVVRAWFAVKHALTTLGS